jgi:hypothetical protein
MTDSLWFSHYAPEQALRLATEQVVAKLESYRGGTPWTCAIGSRIDTIDSVGSLITVTDANGVSVKVELSVAKFSRRNHCQGFRLKARNLLWMRSNEFVSGTKLLGPHLDRVTSRMMQRIEYLMARVRDGMSRLEYPIRNGNRHGLLTVLLPQIPDSIKARFVILSVDSSGRVVAEIDVKRISEWIRAECLRDPELVDDVLTTAHGRCTVQT